MTPENHAQTPEHSPGLPAKTTPRSQEAPGQVKSSLLKRFGWGVAGIIIVLPVAAALIGIKVLQFRAMASAAAHQTVPPQPVNATEVREELWESRIAAVGSVMAFQGTVVSAEASGVVREIKFEPGAFVEAGAELVRLDVDIEEAQLRSAQAAAGLARLSFRRAQELIPSRSVSQADLDSAEATLKQAVAQVENIQAVISKRIVRAPFAGKLGIRRISVGQYLEKGNPVVSLHTLDPVYVEFSLPQQRLSDLTEGLEVAVTSDAYPGRPFAGKITTVNPEIDAATRNVRVQATLSNRDGRLRPGMFVSVELILAKSEKVLFIPAAAVQSAPLGNAVFVIEEGPSGADGKRPLTVQPRMVHLGVRQGDYVAVTDGVKVHERIVSTGVFKLRPGMPVVIDNTLAPRFAFAPKPSNN